MIWARLTDERTSWITFRGTGTVILEKVLHRVGAQRHSLPRTFVSKMVSRHRGHIGLGRVYPTFKIFNGYSFRSGTAPWVTYTLNHSFSTIRMRDGAQLVPYFTPTTGNIQFSSAKFIVGITSTPSDYLGCVCSQHRLVQQIIIISNILLGHHACFTKSGGSNCSTHYPMGLFRDEWEATRSIHRF